MTKIMTVAAASLKLAEDCSGERHLP